MPADGETQHPAPAAGWTRVPGAATAATCTARLRVLMGLQRAGRHRRGCPRLRERWVVLPALLAGCMRLVHACVLYTRVCACPPGTRSQPRSRSDPAAWSCGSLSSTSCPLRPLLPQRSRVTRTQSAPSPPRVAVTQPLLLARAGAEGAFPPAAGAARAGSGEQRTLVTRWRHAGDTLAARLLPRPVQRPRPLRPRGQEGTQPGRRAPAGRGVPRTGWPVCAPGYPAPGGARGRCAHGGSRPGHTDAPLQWRSGPGAARSRRCPGRFRRAPPHTLR